MPSEIHAHETHAYEMHAREMHAHDMYTREVHAYEIYAHQLHAHQIHARKVHAYNRKEGCDIEPHPKIIAVSAYPPISIGLSPAWHELLGAISIREGCYD